MDIRIDDNGSVQMVVPKESSMITNQVKLSESKRALLSSAVRGGIRDYRESLNIAVENEAFDLAKQFQRQIEEAEALVQLIEDAESVIIDKGDPSAT